MVMEKEVILFTLPFAGGSKYSFNIFKTHLPDRIKFCPLDLPGRGTRIRERLETDIFRIVEGIFQQIKGQLNTPYVLYGHSMGSMLVYLLAQKIRKEKEPTPMQLFVSGRGGPACKDGRKRHLLPQKEFRKELMDLGGMPKEVLEDDALMDFYEPILRADFQALETYNYSSSPAFDTPITVMIGKDDKTSFEEAMEWQKETVVPVNVQEFSGGHFFIFDHPKAIVKLITKSFCLKAV